MNLPAPLDQLGLTRLPFPKAPEPQDLYRWPGLEELLARLRFAFACQGFALITGEVGSGKSTALRLFAHGLDSQRQPLLYFADSGLSPREFYTRVLENFGIVPGVTRSRVRQQFQTLFRDLSREQGKNATLVIDEAQDLSLAMVQELRYLQNLGDHDAESPFTLILCGQAELRAMLRLKTFEAVAQRILVRYHLGPLGLEDTDAFLRHGLQTAGVERAMFTEPAVTLLHTHSHGLPRRLGILATHALVDAALHDLQLVEEPSVRRAVADLED